MNPLSSSASSTFGRHATIVGLGYLGVSLAQAVYGRGRSLNAIKRQLTSDEAALPFAVCAAEFNDGDIWQRAPWRADTQADADWFILLPPSPLTDYAQVVARLVEAAHASQAARIILASSISVYGDAPRDCDEHSTLAPETASARAIVQAEQSVLASPLPNRILRLGGLYCAERHPLYSLLRKGQLPRPHAPANMLHRDAAVAALLAAADDADDAPSIRNIVQTPHPSRHEFYRQQAQMLGLTVPAYDADDQTSGKRVFSLYDTES